MNTTYPVTTFNDFIDLIPQPVCLLKACNKVIYAWNTEFKNLTGYSQSEIKGKPWSVIFDPGLKADWKAWIRILNNNETVTDIPSRIIAANDKRISALFSLKKVNIEYEDFFLISITNISTYSGSEDQIRKKLIKEQRLRFHYENSPLAVIEWDKDFIVTLWSKKAEKIFGWKAKETVGKPIESLNIIFPEDIPIVEMTMERLTGGKERTVVSGNRNVTKDGTVIHCIWYNSVLLDEHGKMISVMSLVDDITAQKDNEAKLKVYSEELERMVNERTSELNHLKDNLEDLVRERTSELESNNRKLTKEIVARRRAVEALKESERKYREIVQNIPGMIFQLKVQRDGTNRFTYVSPHAGELFDLPVEAVLDEWEFSNYIHPDDRASFISSIGTAINSQMPWNFEGRILTPNNEIKWFEGFSSPALVGQELVMDGVMLDVTEKKIAQQAIRESEEHFRSLFTSIQEGFHMSRLIFDDNGKAVDFEFLVTNDAFESQSGLSSTQIIGKKASEVFPNLEPEWLETYQRVVRSGHPEHFEQYNKDTDRTYSLFAYRTFDDNFAVIFYDLTEKKEFDRQVKEAQALAQVSENMFRLLFESIKEGFQIVEILFDKKGKPYDLKYLSVNPAWYRQTGIDIDVTGKTAVGIIPNLEQVWIDRHAKVAETGIAEGFEEYNSFTEKFYAIYIYRIEKNVCAALFQDVTRQRIEEQEIKVNLTKFQVLFNSFPLGITITDKSGKILEVNQKAEEILEVEKDENLKRTINDKKWNIIKPDGSILPAEQFASMRALETQNVVSNQEMGLVTDSGEVKWLNVTAAPIPLDGYGVAITYSDITEKIHTREIIEENERSYRTLFNAMSEGFALHEIILDEKGKPVDYRFLDLNPAFEKITGLRKDEIVGKNVKNVLPNIEPEWIRKYGDVAITGKPLTFDNYSHELKKYFKVFAYSPAHLQFAVIFMDISDQKNLTGKKTK